MTRHARQILLRTLLAVYGFAVFGAPALHSSLASNHKIAVASGDEEVPVGLSPSHDDCPICHFHAQGQIVVSSDRQICTDVVQLRPLDEPPLRVLPLPARHSAPRAPPIG